MPRRRTTVDDDERRILRVQQLVESRLDEPILAKYTADDCTFESLDGKFDHERRVPAPVSDMCVSDSIARARRGRRRLAV